MSYARFGASGSNVYVFVHVHGWLECCGCWLSPTQSNGFGYSFKAQTTAEMLAHLHEHERAGHVVPDSTFVTLLEDEAENDAFCRSEAPR